MPRIYDAEDVVFYPTKDGKLVLPLDTVNAEKGKSFVFAFDIDIPGTYSVTLAAKSELSKTAQLPVTLFTTGFPSAVFTFNGTDGAWCEISREVCMYSRFLVCRLYFGGSGLELKELRLDLVKKGMIRE